MSKNRRVCDCQECMDRDKYMQDKYGMVSLIDLQDMAMFTGILAKFLTTEDEGEVIQELRRAREHFRSERQQTFLKILRSVSHHIVFSIDMMEIVGAESELTSFKFPDVHEWKADEIPEEEAIHYAVMNQIIQERAKDFGLTPAEFLKKVLQKEMKGSVEYEALSKYSFGLN